MWDERLAKDVEYVDGISLSRDLHIIFTTMIKVLRCQDVTVDTSEKEGNLAEIRECIKSLRGR
jgi:hypothetical protein